jgi:hypothetical protein
MIQCNLHPIQATKQRLNSGTTKDLDPHNFALSVTPSVTTNPLSACIILSLKILLKIFPDALFGISSIISISFNHLYRTFLSLTYCSSSLPTPWFLSTPGLSVTKAFGSSPA